MSEPFVITNGEAHALHAWLKSQEKMYAEKGDYANAGHCKARALELERAFWPAGKWEEAWSK